MVNISVFLHVLLKLLMNRPLQTSFIAFVPQAPEEENLCSVPHAIKPRASDITAESNSSLCCSQSSSMSRTLTASPETAAHQRAVTDASREEHPSVGGKRHAPNSTKAAGMALSLHVLLLLVLATEKHVMVNSQKTTLESK